jgi:hypothetical protein
MLRDGDAAVPFLLQLQGRHFGQDDAPTGMTRCNWSDER